MIIELTYDPVGPDLIVKVDNQLADSGDIFGFLYPVRSCILQTWLEPSGSWPGLVRQLRELSRGEEIRLIFRGRKCDYDDLVRVVAPMNEVQLSFVPWEAVAKNQKRIQEIRYSLAQLLDAPAKQNQLTFPKTKSGFMTQFPEEAGRVQQLLKDSQPDWLARISSRQEFEEADQIPYQCCIVSGQFFDSYEQLEQLKKLTRSMRRSQDMICCCLADAQAYKDYAFYARQYGNMGFRFAAGDASKEKHALYSKYGEAYELTWQLALFRKILAEIEKCYDQEADLVARRTKLIGSGKKAEQDLLKQKCAWLHSKESYYEKAMKLLYETPAEQAAGKELARLG